MPTMISPRTRKKREFCVLSTTFFYIYISYNVFSFFIKKVNEYGIFLYDQNYWPSSTWEP